MKRFFAVFILFFLASITKAQTCPPIDQILVDINGRYEVVLPPEWLLIVDERSSPNENNLEFGIAAWGDHKHTSDSVRCHYYKRYETSNHILIETQERIPESKINTYPQWDSGSELYHMCGNSTDHNVNACPFG